MAGRVGVLWGEGAELFNYTALELHSFVVVLVPAIIKSMLRLAPVHSFLSCHNTRQLSVFSSVPVRDPDQDFTMPDIMPPRWLVVDDNPGLILIDIRQHNRQHHTKNRVVVPNSVYHFNCFVTGQRGFNTLAHGGHANTDNFREPGVHIKDVARTRRGPLDVVGVESGVSLKNVIAIAAGMCDGLGFGDNTKGALLTRGLAEMTRLGVKMGARQETFSGLAGLGDLITTCISRHSRNRYVGEEIGKGRTLKEVLSGMVMVAEGVRTTRSAVGLAEKHGVEIPIAAQVFEILFKDKPVKDAIKDLMRRSPQPEIWW